MLTNLLDSAGPFLIPIAIFVLGLAGYLFLWLLTRQGILGDE